MSPVPPTADRLRAYLLGGLTQEEADAVERAYFADEEILDALAEAEDDLIVDFLGGRLDGEEGARFERRYLATPVGRLRVAVVRRLSA